MSTKVISRKIPHNHSTGSVHIGSFVKGHLMPIVAVLAAAVTCFFVPFDAQYLGYFDLKTLATLFCTLAVVAAYKNIGFFSWLAKKIVLAFGTLRRVVFCVGVGNLRRFDDSRQRHGSHHLFAPRFRCNGQLQQA